MGATLPFIPYGRHEVTEEDAAAVRDALFGERLTTGPEVEAFETEMAARVGARFGVAFSSGTAALHAAYFAAGVGPDTEIVTTPLTFAATASTAAHLGAKPVFADVNPDTLTLCPDEALAKINKKTMALVPVDYAGHPSAMELFRRAAWETGVTLIEDACHSLGATLDSDPVGQFADITVFSFHPVKHITTGEGGMCVTHCPNLAARMRSFRSHGVDLDANAREKLGVLGYDIKEIGLNYRMPDLNAALGRSQLKRLDRYVERRRKLAALYSLLLVDLPLTLPREAPGARSSFHLYPVRIPEGRRDLVAAKLREKGIGTALHYPALHLMTYFRERFGCSEGDCPVAEEACGELLSLPLFPTLTEGEVRRVVAALAEVL